MNSRQSHFVPIALQVSPECARPTKPGAESQHPIIDQGHRRRQSAGVHLRIMVRVNIQAIFCRPPPPASHDTAQYPPVIDDTGVQTCKLLFGG